MPTACINLPDCRVSLVRERLEVRGRRNAEGSSEELLREIPLRDLDRLIMVESTHLTSAALAALMRAGIPVNLMAWNGNFLGGFLPAQNSHGLARIRQYDRTRDTQFALQMSGRIVTAKIYNQRRVLQRLDAGRKRHASSNPDPNAPDPLDLAPDLAWLDHVFQQAARARSIDELRGYEGASTARYFQAWAGFLPPALRAPQHPPAAQPGERLRQLWRDPPLPRDGRLHPRPRTRSRPRSSACHRKWSMEPRP
jgi:CRISPR-associated protein Cas1